MPNRFVLKVPQIVKHSEVQRFYQDEVIFITGATGFLGKVLVEKLLRSCPGIERIYLLIRPKRDLSPRRRFELFLRPACFQRLRQECPSSLNKLVVVDGDIREEKLGLKSGDYERLASDVSMVFHSAATVRFNEPLRNAVKINMEGTKNVLDLCHNIKKIKAVVHVSTASVHCDLDALEERVYPSTVKPDDIISLTKTLSEVDLVKATPELLGAKPNTYTFTKTLAESIVAEQGRGLPLVIVRPSGVSASWKEPFPYIVIDTQLIVGGDKRAFALSPEDYIAGALTLYLYVINVFLFIPQFLSVLREE
ncbi:putative fatty acyl-CoA reductase CG5065 [Ixodes scapularis]|uniref:putative fatty acyl-CoA reductase CG5065 n=1 Tax=Ixodes scapularis TaxID=6945 RepID=UPI001C37F320|nr:putative fatty acyl-CoA reductase CG5065 [Ixodes scapularis]